MSTEEGKIILGYRRRKISWKRWYLGYVWEYECMLYTMREGWIHWWDSVIWDPAVSQEGAKWEVNLGREGACSPNIMRSRGSDFMFKVWGI